MWISDAIEAWALRRSKTLGDDIPMAERKARYAAFMQAGPVPVLTAAGFKRSKEVNVWGEDVWWRSGDLLVVRIACMPDFYNHCAHQGIDAWARRPRRVWQALTGIDPNHSPALALEFDFPSIDPILEYVLGGTAIWCDADTVPEPLKWSDPLRRAVEARTGYYSDHSGWWLSPIDLQPRWRRERGVGVYRRRRRWRARTLEQVAAAWRDVWTSIVLPFIEELAAAPEAHYLRYRDVHGMDVPVEAHPPHELVRDQTPNFRRAIYHHFAGQIDRRDHIVRHIFNTPDVTPDDLVRSYECTLSLGEEEEIRRIGRAAWRIGVRDSLSFHLETRVRNVMIASRLADHWGIAL